MKYSTLILLFLIAGRVVYGQARLVKDINTTPDDIQSAESGGSIFVPAGDLAYFKMPAAKATTWWVTDGTTAGTREIDAAHTGSELSINAGAFNGSLIYQAVTGSGSQLKIYTPGGPGPQVLKDLVLRSSIKVIRSGDKFLFLLQNEDINELWQSDGTPAGTTKVTNVPGSFIDPVGVHGGDSYTYFTLTTMDEFTNTVWRTDGTAAGTIKIKVSGPLFDEEYGGLFVDGNSLYFGIQKFAAPTELWKSDGTQGGTVKIKELHGQLYSKMQKLNSVIIVATNVRTYVSDGTEAGTTEIFSQGIEWGIIYEGLYYGTATDYNTFEYSLVKTDGTMAGTTTVTGQVNGWPLIDIGDKFLLAIRTPETGVEPGISDGTTAGTILLKDINPGTANSLVGAFARIGDKVVFVANDGVHGNEIWVTDGTQTGTTLLLDARPGTNDALYEYVARFGMIPIGDKLFFQVREGNTIDLWATDGTEANTSRVVDANNYYSFRRIGNLGAEDYFVHDNAEVFKVSRTTQQVTTVKDLSGFNTYGYGGSFKQTEINGKLLFNWQLVGDPPVNFGNEYWVTDGTETGTHILKDINPGPDGGLWLQSDVVMNGYNYFSANDGSTGVELWKTDGTESGTQLLFDINTGAGSSNPQFYFQRDNKFYFFADDATGYELWSTDGISLPVRETDIFPANAQLGYPTPFNDLLAFTAYDVDEGLRLWRTDGTEAGTSVLKTFDSPSHFNSVLVAAGGKLYFTAYDPTYGREIWITDGTPAGTKVLDLTPGVDGTNPSLLQNINGVIYFTVQGEFWKTAGTLATTQKVVDMEPLGFMAAGDQVYFAANSDEYGIELFVTPITKFNQTIALEAVTDKIEGDANFTLTASSTSALPVSFTSTPSGKVTISGNTVTIVKPGKVTITAKAPGNEEFAAAEDKSTVFCINPKKPVVTLKEDKGSSKILQSSASEGNQWYLNDTAINGATATTFDATASGSYSVASTVDGCKSETSIAAVITVTGIEEELNGAIFPNPASDKLIVRWNNPNETVGISIVDSNGRPRFSTSFTNTIDVPVADYSTGIYLVRISVGTKTVTRKFMKQ